MINKISLPIGILGFIFFFYFEHIIAHSTVLSTISFVFIFLIIILSAITVAYHAEALAERFGEPYGTLILTLSAVAVEVIIIIILMISSKNPTLAKDTIYSALMLDINGILGLSAIIGGIKHGEQKYNIDSSNSYVSMIITAIGIAMVLPYFLTESNYTQYNYFIIITFLLMYLVFTRIQTKEHRYFFEFKKNKVEELHEDKEINVMLHASMLFISIVVIGLLSEIMSEFMSETIKSSGLPIGLGAVVVAVISASPEFLTAVRAASKDSMQTVMNIALGASLSTVLLTIPSVIIVSIFFDLGIDLKLSVMQIVLLSLTFIATIINTNDGETNALEGFAHLILFITFVFFSFS